ncbi:MAG: NAD(P)-dependent oxidoreductase [Pseudomonadota bacterium]|nr:NAD(P)-dependent oxidoreductase [Pseudomonadota bacterium]
MTDSVLFYGLGSMGTGMAHSLRRAGFRVNAFTNKPDVRQAFIDAGGESADLAAFAPQAATVVIAVVNAAQTEDILFGSTGLAERLSAGCVVIACPTIDPADARRFEAACEAQGLLYLDAPISGGAAKADAGALSFMASGRPEAFAAAQPFLDAMAASVFNMGERAGAGSVMKAVNQMLAGVHVAMTSEAMAFGMAQGLLPDRVLEVVSQSAGTSWMFENRAPRLIEEDFVPAHASLTIWPKDLGIILGICEQLGLAAPITQAALDRYQQAIDEGRAHEDDASLVKTYLSEAGLARPDSKGGN